MGVKRAAVVVLLAGGAAACGSDDDDGSASDKEPLRVAIIPPLGEPFGIYGKAALDEWKLAAEEATPTVRVDGPKVEIVESETNGQPATSLREVRDVVTQDKVGLLAGVVSSAERAPSRSSSYAPTPSSSTVPRETTS